MYCVAATESAPSSAGEWLNPQLSAACPKAVRKLCVVGVGVLLFFLAAAPSAHATVTAFVTGNSPIAGHITYTANAVGLSSGANYRLCVQLVNDFQWQSELRCVDFGGSSGSVPSETLPCPNSGRYQAFANLYSASGASLGFAGATSTCNTGYSVDPQLDYQGRGATEGNINPLATTAQVIAGGYAMTVTVRDTLNNVMSTAVHSCSGTTCSPGTSVVSVVQNSGAIVETTISTALDGVLATAKSSAYWWCD